MNNDERFSDDTFLAAFNECSAPPSAFNHEGHLRIAWIHLQRYLAEEAIRLTCEGIARFANHLGAPDKYNRTLSEALMKIMANRGAGNKERPFDVFLAENPDMVEDALGLLRRYYTDERLTSPAARSAFVLPDLLPLP